MSSIKIKFNNSNKHIYSQSPIVNYLLQITQLILKYYTIKNAIRLYHYNKKLGFFFLQKLKFLSQSVNFF